MDEPLMTIDELAAFLRIPKATIYNWSYRGGGPVSYRVGKHLRYRRTDVLTYLETLKRG